MDSALRTVGFHPSLVCPMVANVLDHHYLQRDFQVFYLRDEGGADSLLAPVVAVRYPDRLLERALRDHPHLGWLHELRGHYLRLKLEQTRPHDPQLAEQTAAAYQRAVQNGIRSLRVFAWLGGYYVDQNRPRLAQEMLEAALNLDSGHVLANFHLARLSFRERRYSQAYASARNALGGDSLLQPVQRYDATRMMALSLANLGETDRFVDYIVECIRQLPDIQAGYLDLIDHYTAIGRERDILRGLYREMLLRNPYDQAGYKHLERYAVGTEDFAHAERILEEILANYEHADEAVGNVYRFRGNLLFRQGRFEEARTLWDISRSYYARCLPPDSPLLKEIGQISLNTSANGRGPNP